MGTGQHPLNSPSEETLATVVVRDDGPQCQGWPPLNVATSPELMRSESQTVPFPTVAERLLRPPTPSSVIPSWVTTPWRQVGSVHGSPWMHTHISFALSDTTPIDNAVATSSNRVIKLAREALSLLKLEDKSARPGAA